MTITSAILAMLSMTVMLEAGGEGTMGQRAVVYTILNRAANADMSIHEVLTQPKQYSCYDKIGLDNWMANPRYMVDAREYISVVSKAIQAWDSPVRSLFPPGGLSVFNATNYHSKDVAPWWSKSSKMHMVAGINNHIFYVEER